MLELSGATARSALCRVLAARDRDCDRRLTVLDAPPGRPGAAFERYAVELDSVKVTLSSTHEAAQLVTELAGSLKRGENVIRLDLERVHLDPVGYLETRTRGAYVDGLTRRIDGDPEELARAAADEKVGTGASGDAELCPEARSRCGEDPNVVTRPKDGPLFVYYPAGDPQAAKVFGAAGVEGSLVVRPLPLPVTRAWMEGTTRKGEHGLLTLALDAEGRGRPFVVPGGRFNEMYGWDSYFITLGLLEDPARIELARAMVDNHAYEIDRYGKILNANRTYYLTRSQPPFFAAMLAAVWRTLPHDDANRAWLRERLRAALREYSTIWTVPPRRLALCEKDVCLSRYYGEGHGEPPEVEPGAFDWFYQSHALAHGHCPKPAAEPESQARFLACAAELGASYRAGKVKDPAIDTFFVNDRAVRESGHDTTFRWFSGGTERATDFATVDLNALLFRAEVELATLLEQNFSGALERHSTKDFCRRAEARARLVRRYLWDENAGLFFDYDTRERRRSGYVSATTLYPLWASTPNACRLSLVTPEMSQRLRERALAELETKGGLLSTSKRSLATVETPVLLRRGPGGIESTRPGRQWEAPNGWAPHQMLAWVGLRAAGFGADAERLAYRWLYTIAKNSRDFHGTVPEKFDVESRSHAVFQEYGNVNTKFSYIAEEGFGWMNASFLVGIKELGDARLRALRALTPPEALW